MRGHRLYQLLCLLAVCPLLVLVYWPGLSGPFIFDDLNNIVLNPDVAISDLQPRSLSKAAWSNDSGPLKRPLASLTFALNYYVVGGFTETIPYKLTNLLIHLLNTLLVYWLSLLLTRRLQEQLTGLPRWLSWVPILTAAAWGLHPLNLTSVLYVVQRMTSLATLFMLAGLIVFVYGRIRVRETRHHGYALMSCGLAGGVLLGLTAKENAALLPLLAVVIEVFFFRPTADTVRTDRGLAWFYALLVVLPWTLLLLWLALNPQIVLGTYEGRDFTLAERLLTEARVLWFYIGLLLFPRISGFGIFHDDIAFSTSLLAPWSTLPALLGVLLVAMFALVSRRRLPLLGFAVLWFFVGHAIESGIIGLEIAHEHRNYLPSFGILFALGYGLAWLAARLAQPWLGITLAACYVGTLALTTHSRAWVWASEDNLAYTAVAHHPRSPRAHYTLAELKLARNEPLTALEHYRHTAELDPRDAHALIKLIVAASAISIMEQPADGHMRARDLGLPEFLSLTKVEGQLKILVEPAITREIERRLGEEVVRPHIVVSLATLSSCVLSPNCRHLYHQATKWYGLTLKNPRMDQDTRERLVNGLARLYLRHSVQDNTAESDHMHQLARQATHPSVNR